MGLVRLLGGRAGAPLPSLTIRQGRLFASGVPHHNPYEGYLLCLNQACLSQSLSVSSLKSLFEVQVGLTASSQSDVGPDAEAGSAVVVDILWQDEEAGAAAARLLSLVLKAALPHPPLSDMPSLGRLQARHLTALLEEDCRPCCSIHAAYCRPA